MLAIRDGYAWNGANYFPDFEWVLRASMVHDALCQLLDKGDWSSHAKGKNGHHYRKCSDREFYCIAKVDKGPRWAAVTYAAIRSHVKVPLVGGLFGGAFGLGPAALQFRMR